MDSLIFSLNATVPVFLMVLLGVLFRRLGWLDEALAGKLIRLHVLASSDSEEDQAAKLAARDAVLSVLEPLLEGAEDTAEAAGRMARAGEELAAAASLASGQSARVTLTREAYPTRRYEDFRLPAGEYLSLRVILGKGEGRNWWCVAYPPLCMQTVTREVWEAGAFDEGEVRLLTEEGGEYEIRFRLLELWGELSAKLRGRVQQQGDAPAATPTPDAAP